MPTKRLQRKQLFWFWEILSAALQCILSKYGHLRAVVPGRMLGRIIGLIIFPLDPETPA